MNLHASDTGWAGRWVQGISPEFVSHRMEKGFAAVQERRPELSYAIEGRPVGEYTGGVYRSCAFTVLPLADRVEIFERISQKRRFRCRSCMRADT